MKQERMEKENGQILTTAFRFFDFMVSLLDHFISFIKR
jgi:hypothetical protein